MYSKSLTLLIVAVLFAPAVIAEEDYIMDTSGIGKSHNGVVSSDQILELGEISPNALRLEGEAALRSGNLDRALMVLQRSVEMAPLDADGRIMYAQALEQKLMRQKRREPALFNYCVKQWFFVAQKAEFPDQSLQGKSHLLNLTGIVPRPWEKDSHYLQRVMLPEDGSEPVRLAMGTKKHKTDKDKTTEQQPKDKE